MAPAREIQQIEYRWEQRKDLVPVASSMSPGTEQSWDSLIYSWVRHPDTDVTSESVRYQVFPDGRAALAWRFRNPRAAKQEDGTHGRPLVSRVLVAQPGLLTPDIAIVLCRVGLPGPAGHPPGEVSAGTALPPVSVDELRNQVVAQAETMDVEAAHETGLAQLLTAALAEPGLPLAIQLPAPYICDPVRVSPQPLLLWGLWRIGRPLLDDAGRGWSFSTFEAPLGDSEPSRLPDIVFRLDQPVLHAPVRSRTERRVRPRDPSAQETLSFYPEMPAWLVEEYEARGGDELGCLFAQCSAGAHYDTRLGVVYDQLRVNRRVPSPSVASEPGSAQDEHAEQDKHGQPERYEREEPEQSQSAEPEPQAPTTRRYGQQEYEQTAPYEVTFPVEDENPPPSGYERAVTGRPPKTWQPPGRGESPAEFPPSRQGAVASPLSSHDRPVPAQRTATETLGQLTMARDDREFQSALQHIRSLGTQTELGDRRQACYGMQNNNWYIPDLLRYGYVPCENELAAILRVILLPDLELVQVQRQMAQWVLDAGAAETRPLIRSLLLAPRGDDASKQMRRLLRPALAARLIVDYECLDVWPSSEPEPPASDPGGSSGTGFRRLFRGGRD